MNAPARSSAAAPGSVTLIGAGPGDPELITFKAARAIAQATLILIDDLADPGVLAHAAPGARVEYVGKRGGHHGSTPQAEIEQRMIEAARAGERVARIKGGDPFIFGRGGEELESLARAGIAASAVNGITAGLAAATAIGAPLTHRDHAPGVLFLTGHPRKDSPDAESVQNVDWACVGQAARDLRLTLVIYMGVARLPAIRAGLLTALPPDTPAAAIRNASRPDETRCLTTLGALLDDATRAGIASPAILIVGDVARGARETMISASDILARPSLRSP